MSLYTNTYQTSVHTRVAMVFPEFCLLLYPLLLTYGGDASQAPALHLAPIAAGIRASLLVLLTEMQNGFLISPAPSPLVILPRSPEQMERSWLLQ